MTCYNCHKDILEGSRYCYYCGAAQKPVNPPPPTAQPVRPVRRSRKDKKIAGVCSGFAENYGWDVSIVRVIWVILSLPPFGFAGLVAYLICWIIIPAEEIQGSPAAPAPPQPSGS